MNKIIPVITLIMSVLELALSVIAIIVMCIAVRVSGVALVAVPTAIVGTFLSLLSVPFAFLFRRDKLCHIAFYIGIAAFVISAASIVVWLVAL